MSWTTGLAGTTAQLVAAGEAADLAAQLPTLLRGAYYEAWRPAAVPVKHRGKADFLSRVE
jgi:uncharacterized protein (DUF2267 family)